VAFQPTMLTALLPLLLATTPTPTPPAPTTTTTTAQPATTTTTDPGLPRHFTLGVRTLAIAEMWLFVPDLGHTGGGFGVFGGSTIGDRFEVRLGVDGRSLDEGMGYCLEKCGHPGVLPPDRAVRQLKLVPWMEVRWRFADLGPVGFVVGMNNGVPIGTSLDGNDPIIVGLVNTLIGGVAVDVGSGWSFESSLRLESGMHFVTGSPEPGHTSVAGADAAFVYRFPD
jgi:hypothetical protein